jgi:hypothetical protein
MLTVCSLAVGPSGPPWKLSSKAEWMGHFASISVNLLNNQANFLLS